MNLLCPLNWFDNLNVLDVRTSSSVLIMVRDCWSSSSAIRKVSQDVWSPGSMNLRVLLPPYKNFSLWMQVLSFIMCFPSGVALLSAGCDAWLTVLQSEPLESKLPAKIPLGLMHNYEVNFKSHHRLIRLLLSLLGVYCPVFPFRKQGALDSLFVLATKLLTQVGITLSYQLFTDLSISLDFQFTLRNF